jgi:WD40 repeat protein
MKEGSDVSHTPSATTAAFLSIFSLIFIRPVPIQAQQSLPQLVATFSHDDEIRGFLWSHDERRILSWSYDQTARLWDVNGGLIATISHPDVVIGASWSGDETIILTWWVGGDSVMMWDTEGHLISTLDHNAPVAAPIWSKIVRILSWSGSTVRIWSRDGRQLALLENGAFVTGAIWSGDETQILSWSEDNRVRLWSATGTLLATLDQDESAPGLNLIIDAGWSPDENCILYYTRTAIYIWSAEGQLVTSFTHNGNTVGGAIWHSNSREVLSWSFDNTVRIWNVEGKLLATLSHDNWVVGAEWNPTGTLVLSWSADSTARVWDNEGHQLVVTDMGRRYYHPTIGLTYQVYHAYWSKDGSHILSVSNMMKSAGGELCVVLLGYGRAQGQRGKLSRRFYYGAQWIRMNANPDLSR